MTPAELSRTVLATVRRAVAADELAVAVPERIVVQRPPRPGCGDYATNVALQLAGPAGRTPYEVAEILGRRLSREPGIAQVEIAGAGFLNITLSASAYGDVVRQVRAQPGEYGHGDGLADEAVTMTTPPLAPAPAPTGPSAAPPGQDPARGQAPVPGQTPPPSRAPLVADVVNRLLRATGARPGPPETVTVAEPAPPPPPALPLQNGTTPLSPDETNWALLRAPAEDTPRLTPDLLVQRECNPLFRVRYAHSRTRALLHNAHDLGVEIEAPAQDPYRHPAETELLGLLADYPRVIETAARRRAPDRVARHLERLADAFFRFHDECDPLPKGDEKPSAVHAARIRLADATGIVLADGLRMLGISAPDHM